MDFISLIPAPDTIPAPSWLFLILDILLFTLHILVINVIVGSILITLFNRMKPKDDILENRLHGAVAAKIPTLFAIGINLGVAPLLFMQVIYGHLFYSSSVLMAVYWILVIPFLILAYYGAYIHIRKYSISAALSKSALWLMTIFVLYIAFMLVNNNTLMLQPAKWTAYFNNRGGTILNWGDPTLIPRYLHFIVASIAVSGLVMAFIWNHRLKQGIPAAAGNIKTGLKIFAFATIIQIVIGLWFLLAIPKEFMMNFMGGDLLATILLTVGFLGAIGAIISALRGKCRPALYMLLVTIIAMIINRQNLRSMYLEDTFNLSSLQLAPQYDVLFLFLIILVVGLVAVGYMIRIAFMNKKGRTAE